MIKNRTAILGLLTGLNFLNYLDRYILASVLDDVQKEFSLSNFEGGFLFTAFLLGYFTTAPFFGARADKGTRKGLITIGVVVWSLATAATGLANGFWSLLAARAFVGVGEAAYATLAPTIIDDITPPDRKNRALAVFYLAMPVGSALGFALGGTIAKQINWQAAFFLAGGPGLVLALTVLLIEEPPRKLRAAKAKIGDSLRTLFAIPLYRRSVIGYTVYTAALGAFASWGPMFLVNEYAGTLDKQSAGIWFGATTTIAGILGTFIGGRWADRALRAAPSLDPTAPHDALANRIGINAMLRVCAIGMAIATPLGAACFLAPSAYGFFVAAFACQIGLWLSTSPVNAVALRAVPAELRASAMAAQLFVVHLFGDLWSPPALGLLQDNRPARLAMMALPLAFAFTTYLWWPRSREAA